MKPSMLHIALCSATFAGVIVLSACGKQDQSQDVTPPPASTAPPAPAAAPDTNPPPTMPPPSSSAPAPASTSAMPAGSRTTSSLPPETLKVAGVKLGNQVSGQQGVSEARHRFAPSDPTIYASVTTQGQTQGATLSAQWSYLEGKAQPITQTDQQFSASGPAVTTFEVRNPNLWPAGKYQVVISLNGKPVSTQPFEISKS